MTPDQREAFAERDELITALHGLQVDIFLITQRLAADPYFAVPDWAAYMLYHTRKTLTGTEVAVLRH